MALDWYDIANCSTGSLYSETKLHFITNKQN